MTTRRRGPPTPEADRRGGGVVLIGPRCAGKSTLAPRLAAALGWSAADTDELVAAAVGRPAGEFLRAEGEVEFRAVEERQVLAALAGNRQRVLALGGGAVLSGKTRALLARPEHFVVYVTAPVEVLVERANTGPDRPQLTGLELRDEVRELLERREPWYRELSDLELDTFSSNVSACLRSITATMVLPPG